MLTVTSINILEVIISSSSNHLIDSAAHILIEPEMLPIILCLHLERDSLLGSPYTWDLSYSIK